MDHPDVPLTASPEAHLVVYLQRSPEHLASLTTAVLTGSSVRFARGAGALAQLAGAVGEARVAQLAGALAVLAGGATSFAAARADGSLDRGLRELAAALDELVGRRASEVTAGGAGSPPA